MHNDSVPHPAVVIGCQILTMLVVFASFWFLPRFGGLVSLLGAGVMLVPVGIFGLCLALYWRRNRDKPVWKWYAGAMTAGFAMGYFLSFGLAFLIATGD